jgi:hypothetical protein
VDTKTGKQIASLSPALMHTDWSMWNVAMPQDSMSTVEIIAEDAGAGWGQWLAIGVPHPISSGLGEELTGGAVGLQGSWIRDGYPPNAHPLIKGTIYGSWKSEAAGDPNTGTLHLGPFSIKGQKAIAIPLMTGANDVANLGLSLKVLNAKTGKIIGSLNPPPMRAGWWAWNVHLPEDPDLSIEIVAEDSGTGPEQWLAIGLPRALP